MMTNLEKRIMRRVYAVFIMRQLTRPMAVKLYGVCIAAFTLSFFVSFQNVIANMPSFSDFNRLYTFNVSAVTHTELVVQFILIALLGILVALSRDIMQAFRHRDHSLSLSS